MMISVIYRDKASNIMQGVDKFFPLIGAGTKTLEVFLLMMIKLLGTVTRLYVITVRELVISEPDATNI